LPTFEPESAKLIAAMKSIRVQSFSAFECIIVDDTPDARVESLLADCGLLADERFRYVRHGSRLGIAASLNVGIALSKSEWIARADADDVLHPEKLENQWRALQADPSIDVLGTDYVSVTPQGKKRLIEQPTQHKSIIRKMRAGLCAIAHPTAIFRKATLLEVGGYNEQLPCAEDLDLLLRLDNAGKRFGSVDLPLLEYAQGETHRSDLFWSINLRTRITNYSSKSMLSSVFGIMVVWIHMVSPTFIKALTYKLLRG